MSEFSYKDYEQAMNAAKNRSNSNSNANDVQIKYFKLTGDGSEAIVRFDLETLDDLHFASVHKPNFSTKYEGLTNPYAGVSCLNILGSKEKVCPFCEAAAAEHPVIGKASKKVFLKMIVRYIDRKTNQLSDPEYVVWERPAGFYKELALFLKNGKGLKNKLLIVSRLDNPRTSYRIIPADQDIYPNDLIPTDFTPFDNLRFDRFSYKVKSLDEMNEYLANGSFPAPVTETSAQEPNTTTSIQQETVLEKTETVQSKTTEPEVLEPKTETKAEETSASSNEEPKRNFNWSW